jgi:hypothetical protein
VILAPPASASKYNGIEVELHYEIYPNIPLITKWVSINSTAATNAGVVVSSVSPETLRLIQPYSPLSFSPYPPSTVQVDFSSFLYVMTDEAHSAMVNWIDDSAVVATPGAECAQMFTNYSGQVGVVLSGGREFNIHGTSRKPILHAARVGDALAEFVSFRTFLLVTDTTDPVRFGLSLKKLYRLWAPQIMENPIFFHGTDASDAGFKLSIDQMKQVGFEMYIFSFGSSFDYESTDPNYISQIKAQIAYANANGIEVGGYDLIVLERGTGYGGNVGLQWDTMVPTSPSDPTLVPGLDACIASGWYDKLSNFTQSWIANGLSMVETDGPYGGEPCYSTNHSYHVNGGDSVYQQTKIQNKFYSELRQNNVFINQPDSYYFQGGSKSGYGYNEDQYNLGPLMDVTITRMTILEDSLRKTPTMGWVFLPLVPYHGGSDSQFEPMSQNFDAYNMGLASYLLSGVAACYRGYRLYDTPEVQALVTYWVNVAKTYRSIILADLIPIQRPDGQSIDGFLHVDAKQSVPGFAAFFNPTNFNLTQLMKVPLYYTGITSSSIFSHEGVTNQTLTLARDYSVSLNVTLAPFGCTWFVITSNDGATVATF